MVAVRPGCSLKMFSFMSHRDKLNLGRRKYLTDNFLWFYSLVIFFVMAYFFPSFVKRFLFTKKLFYATFLLSGNIKIIGSFFATGFFRNIWVLPELFLLFSSLGLLSFCLYGKINKLSTLVLSEWARRWCFATLCVLAVLYAYFFCMNFYGVSFTVRFSSLYLLNGLIQSNLFLLFIKFVIVSCRALVVRVRGRLEVKQGTSYEYFLFVLLGIFSSLIFISAKNMLVFFMAMEIQNLCWITLLRRGKGIVGTERAMKYFFISALAGCFFIIGIYFFFIVFNTFSISAWSIGFRVLFEDSLFSMHAYFLMAVKYLFVPFMPELLRGIFEISEVAPVAVLGFETNAILLLGLAFLVFPILIKMGVFPFSYWIRDVYSGATFCTIGLLSYVSKTAYLVVLFRFFGYFGQTLFDKYWAPIFLFCLVGSLLYSALMTYMTQRLRAFLGLSGIIHIAFVFLGFFPWRGTCRFPSYGVGFFYYMVYVISSLVFFCILCLVEYSRILLGLDYFSDLKGLLKTHPLYSFFIIGVCFVWVGIPPFLGFWAKIFVLLNVVQLPIIIRVRLLSHVITRVYYLRLVQNIAFDEPETRRVLAIRIPALDSTLREDSSTNYELSGLLFWVLGGLFIFLFFGIIVVIKYNWWFIFGPDTIFQILLHSFNL